MTFALPKLSPDDHGSAEREWLRRLSTGDEEAFERIFREFAAGLCAFVYSYVRDQDTAQEIVQDLFCAIWDQRFTIEMPHGMRPFLYAAARNRALNVLRDRRTELEAHERLFRDRRATAPAHTAHDELAARDLAAAADGVVAAMPPRCREVFTLIRDRHLSYAQVARVLDISPKTVEIHMSRALAILRAELAGWLCP
jgi:RNA polymerase sigma-70 factor (ECF subfamily)